MWDLTGPQLFVFGAVVLAANLPLIFYALRPAAPVTAAVPFHDDFERREIGPHYRTIGGQPRIVNGVLQVPGVKNNPLWLQVALPANVRIEFDARSDSTEGDIKCEIFGNGYDHQSGYVLIFGGWSNSVSIIARLDEHGESLSSLQARERTGQARLGSRTPYRVERREPRVVLGRTYRWRLERVGGTLRWYVDNELFIELDDRFPLAGAGHDRLGFSSWDAMVSFDNLSITPL